MCSPVKYIQTKLLVSRISPWSCCQQAAAGPHWRSPVSHLGPAVSKLLLDPTESLPYLTLVLLSASCCWTPLKVSRILPWSCCQQAAAGPHWRSPVSYLGPAVSKLLLDPTEGLPYLTLVLLSASCYWTPLKVSRISPWFCCQQAATGPHWRSPVSHLGPAVSKLLLDPTEGLPYLTLVLLSTSCCWTPLKVSHILPWSCCQQTAAGPHWRSPVSYLGPAVSKLLLDPTEGLPYLTLVLLSASCYWTPLKVSRISPWSCCQQAAAGPHWRSPISYLGPAVNKLLLDPTEGLLYLTLVLLSTSCCWTPLKVSCISPWSCCQQAAAEPHWRSPISYLGPAVSKLLLDPTEGLL